MCLDSSVEREEERERETAVRVVSIDRLSKKCAMLCETIVQCLQTVICEGDTNTSSAAVAMVVHSSKSRMSS